MRNSEYQKSHKLILFIFLLTFSHQSLARQCKENEGIFDDHCIPIPNNAEKTSLFPGWKCIEGFVQKRDHCIPLDKPKGSKLNTDGNSWHCKSGYESYRGTCRKK